MKTPTIYWDCSKAGRSRHLSGLQRVARSLRDALVANGADLVPVRWDSRRAGFLAAEGPERGNRIPGQERTGVFLTPELFSERERPGMRAWIQATPHRTIALFHDSIPLQMPECTWPQSVQRHPYYLDDLCRFQSVLAVSSRCAAELRGFWKWKGVVDPPQVAVVPSGSDCDGSPRIRSRPGPLSDPPLWLCTAIIEPRKNQDTLIEACESLWNEGLRFRLVLAGRVNPHFGAPILRRVRALRSQGYPLEHLPAPTDEQLRPLYERAHLSVFPSLAEGNGLPILEALWKGVPVVASAVPAAREWSAGHGVRVVDPITPAKLSDALRDLLRHPDRYAELQNQVGGAPLKSWNEAARSLLEICGMARECGN